MSDGSLNRWVQGSPWMLIGWTVLLWFSRLRNVLSDQDLTAAGRGMRVGVVVVFVALAAIAGFGLVRNKLGPLVILAVWSIGYWLIRGFGILIGDWSVGFKAVHTALMLVSLVLASGALLRARGSDRVNHQGQSIEIG